MSTLDQTRVAEIRRLTRLNAELLETLKFIRRRIPALSPAAHITDDIIQRCAANAPVAERREDEQ